MASSTTSVATPVVVEGVASDMTPPYKEYVLHPHPAWRDRSDFIINFELPDKERPQTFEQLFTRKIEEDLFEVCCIPFFIYDMALGDLVTTAPEDGRTYLVSSVVQPSGRFVFRVWFGDTANSRDETVETLMKLGSLMEWFSVDLLAVDAEDEVHAKRVADFLANEHRAGRLIYEPGRT